MQNYYLKDTKTNEIFDTYSLDIYKDAERYQKVTKKQFETFRKFKMEEYLLNIFEETQNVYYLITQVSNSGMSRHIRFFVSKDNSIKDITRQIATILNYQMYVEKGLKIKGCGMNMGFKVIYDLSRHLFNDGYILKDHLL